VAQKKCLCVLVEEAEGTFGDRKIGETYVIARPYVIAPT
jgi:hypothetical protein